MMGGHSLAARVRGAARTFAALAPATRQPLALASLLVGGPGRQCEFRIGGMTLAARRTDLTAVSEFSSQAEYAFLEQWPAPHPDPLVLDLGANIGCFAAAVFSRYPAAEVHSFEPSPDTFAVLDGNRRRHPRLRWTAHHAAVAATPGRLPFANGGASTARRLAAGPDSVEVAAETLDGIIARVAAARRVWVCKMDVEGAEAGIFERPLDALRHIDHFVIEIHGGAPLTDRIRQRLAAVFPHVRAIDGRRSSKPLLHAYSAQGAAACPGA